LGLWLKILLIEELLEPWGQLRVLLAALSCVFGRFLDVDVHHCRAHHFRHGGECVPQVHDRLRSLNRCGLLLPEDLALRLLGGERPPRQVDDRCKGNRQCQGDSD
jgi:hypothetical protein